MCLTLQASGQPKNIVQIASDSENFSTLVTAVKSAGLAETLMGEGPFTILAPDNDAFARIDSKTLDFLLNEPGKASLKRILLHHVISGKVKSDQIVDINEVTTLAGTVLPISVIKNRVLIGDAAVTRDDLVGSNGVIHVIDRVLLPPEKVNPVMTVLNNAINRGSYLFNEGLHQSCSDIYETALESIALLSPKDLMSSEIKNLNKQIATIQKMTNYTDKAWAYRAVMDEIIESNNKTKPMANNISPRNETVLFDFDNFNESSQWRVVLDGVMGGLSSGKTSYSGNSLIFEGSTSLRNNGGFSSIRAPINTGSLSDFNAIRLRIRGDGRTWIFGTKASRFSGGDSYWSRFETIKNKWMIITIPLNEMVRHSFGTPLRGKVNPKEILGTEFYMYDKKEGPFFIEIDEITALNI